MKIHLEPLVILLARPSIVPEGVERLLDEYGMLYSDWQRSQYDGDGDSLPELAGRVCYGSFGSRQGRVGAANYISHILESGHGSVLEHAQWTFAICRVSRGFTHQMVRHRAGCAFSQESQHFIHYSEDGTKGVQEPAICLTGLPPESRAAAEGALRASVNAYDGLWKELRSSLPEGFAGKKIASGSARGLLPGAMESRLVFSANARALRHVIELRGNADNVLEIRLVAVQLARVMKIEAPAIFCDFEETTDLDGYPAMSCKWRKV